MGSGGYHFEACPNKAVLDRPRRPIRSGSPICATWSKSTASGSTGLLIFDGYSRAIVGAACFERQNLSRLSQVLRQTIAQWGAPDAVVSDHAKVFLALHPCLTQLGIRWSPITKGHPWQNLAEGGFGVQRRMLDAYVVGSPKRETVYRQHTQFVQDYQFWGHWAHKRTDAQGRIFSLSPEVVLGQAQGRAVEPGRLHRTFRLRYRTRIVRTYGHIRLHNFGGHVDRSLWGQSVDVLIDDDAARVERPSTCWCRTLASTIPSGDGSPALMPEGGSSITRSRYPSWLSGPSTSCVWYGACHPISDDAGLSRVRKYAR